MAAKTLSINCSEQHQQDLCTAIRLYAEAAYPPGGSECAQVARETLVDVARSIDEQFSETGYAEIRRRLRTQLKAAVEFYAEAAQLEGRDVSSVVSELQCMLKGEMGSTP